MGDPRGGELVPDENGLAALAAAEAIVHAEACAADGHDPVELKTFPGRVVRRYCATCGANLLENPHG